MRFVYVFIALYYNYCIALFKKYCIAQENNDVSIWYPNCRGTPRKDSRIISCAVYRVRCYSEIR